MKKAAIAVLFLLFLIQFTPYGVVHSLSFGSSPVEEGQKTPVRTSAQLEAQGYPRMKIKDKLTGEMRLETEQEHENRAAIAIDWAKGTGY